MALGWNGDGARCSRSKKPAQYVVAKEGGEFWVDSYVIPVGAKNPDAAHAWIDFVYQPKDNARRDVVHVLRLAAQAVAAEGTCSPGSILKRPERLPAAGDGREARAEPGHRRRERDCGSGSGRSSRAPSAGSTGPRRPSSGAGRPRRCRRPALPGLARSAGASAWYAAFFLVPLGFIARTASARSSATRDIAYTWNLDNYRYLWDPLYGEVISTATLRRDAKRSFGTLTTLAHRLPVRLLHRPLRAAQDAAAPARHRPVLDELPDPHLRLADHPRSRVPGLRRSARASATRDPLHAEPRSTSASPTTTCRSWCCRSTRRSSGSTGRSSTQPRISATRPGARSAASRCRSRCPGSSPGSLLVFIPLTGEYLIPAILGGNKTFYAGQPDRPAVPRGARLAVRVGDRDGRRSAALTDRAARRMRARSARRSSTSG